MEWLKELVAKRKMDIEQMENAFLAIHSMRRMKSYAGSDMEEAFLEVMAVPV